MSQKYLMYNEKTGEYKEGSARLLGKRKNPALLKKVMRNGGVTSDWKYERNQDKWGDIKLQMQSKQVKDYNNKVQSESDKIKNSVQQEPDKVDKTGVGLKDVEVNYNKSQPVKKDNEEDSLKKLLTRH